MALIPWTAEEFAAFGKTAYNSDLCWKYPRRSETQAAIDAGHQYPQLPGVHEDVFMKYLKNRSTVEGLSWYDAHGEPTLLEALRETHALHKDARAIVDADALDLSHFWPQLDPDPRSGTARWVGSSKIAATVPRARPSQPQMEGMSGSAGALSASSGRVPRQPTC